MKLKGLLFAALFILLGANCYAAQDDSARIDNLNFQTKGGGIQISGQVQNLSAQDLSLKIYFSNGSESLTAAILPKADSGQLNVFVNNFLPPKGYLINYSFIPKGETVKISNESVLDTKPRVFVDSTSIVNETTMEFSLRLKNFPDAPIKAKIFWKKKDSKEAWKESQEGIIDNNLFERFWLSAKNLEGNIDYVFRLEVKSPKVSLSKESEIVTINGKKITREKTGWRVFKISRKPKLMTHSVKIDKSKMPWKISLLAGIVPLNIDFTGWFKIIEQAKGGNIEYTSLPVKYKKSQSSYSAVLSLVGQSLVSNNKTVFYNFKPGTKYQAVAYAQNAAGIVRAKQVLNFAIDKTVPALVKVLPVSHLTPKSAVLRARVEYFGAPQGRVGFKIWKKGQKPPYVFNPQKELAATVGEKNNVELLSVLEKNTQYCYFPWAQSSAQGKAYSTGSTACFTTPNSDYLAVPFYSQNDQRWANCSWNECNSGAVFWKSGCGETALAQIVAYWYGLNPKVKENWDKEFIKVLEYYKAKDQNIYRRMLIVQNGEKGVKAAGKGPNPYFLNKLMRMHGAETCDWNEKLSEVLSILNLRIYRLTSNDKNAANSKFINQGIPLLSRCSPSWITGTLPGHYGTITGFFGSKTYVNQYGQKYFDQMYINDPGKKVEEENDSNPLKRGKAQMLSIGQETHFAECGYQYRNDKNAWETLEGATAVFPSDYPTTNYLPREFNKGTYQTNI